MESAEAHAKAKTALVQAQYLLVGSPHLLIRILPLAGRAGKGMSEF